MTIHYQRNSDLDLNESSRLVEIHLNPVFDVFGEFNFSENIQSNWIPMDFFVPRTGPLAVVGSEGPGRLHRSASKRSAAADPRGEIYEGRETHDFST